MEKEKFASLRETCVEPVEAFAAGFRICSQWGGYQKIVSSQKEGETSRGFPRRTWLSRSNLTALARGASVGTARCPPQVLEKIQKISDSDVFCGWGAVLAQTVHE
jgi:hypothetical protein